MSFSPCPDPDGKPPEGRLDQAEGCPVKTAPFPKSRTQTEISLDIGSPSFRYVADRGKVGASWGSGKARNMTKLEIMLPESLSGAVDTLSRQTGQAREDIIARAIELYLDGRSRWHADMQKALDDVDQDLGHDGDAVLAWMDRWGEEPGMLPPASS